MRLTGSRESVTFLRSCTDTPRLCHHLPLIMNGRGFTSTTRTSPSAQSQSQPQSQSPNLPIESGVSCTKRPACYTIKTTASHGSSKDALALLQLITTPSTVLFDPRYTSQPRPNPAPPFRTFPPSPEGQKLAPTLPSTISIQNLDAEPPAAIMDKRHPSSFQQLEKLGEGTYATVSEHTQKGSVRS